LSGTIFLILTLSLWQNQAQLNSSQLMLLVSEPPTM